MTPVRTPFRTYTNDKGRTFAVRYLPEGARYGRTNALTADCSTVEFYDTTSADDYPRDQYAGFGPLGQFVSRYDLATLREDRDYASGRRGLCLDGGGNAEVWSIDGATMRRVMAWLFTLGNTWDDGQIETFLDGYVSAAVETLADDEREKITADVAPYTLLVGADRTDLRGTARMFYDHNASDLATWFDPHHAGYDLWMTHNREDVGYWACHLATTDSHEIFSAYAVPLRHNPGPWVAEFDAAKARLSENARKCGDNSAYVGDDGKIHTLR